MLIAKTVRELDQWIKTYVEEKGSEPVFLNASEEESSDMQWVIRTFKQLFDLFGIYGQETLNLYKSFLIVRGWEFSRILELERYGLENSNWSNNKHVSQEVQMIKGKSFATTWLM